MKQKKYIKIDTKNGKLCQYPFFPSLSTLLFSAIQPAPSLLSNQILNFHNIASKNKTDLILYNFLIQFDIPPVSF
jgi:hypothetical protein